MHKILTLLAALMLFSSTCWSGETASEVDKPHFSATETVLMTALVESINHETREVTLRGPEGNTASFVVGEEARNLDQVAAGDIVSAEYVQSISVEVMAAEGAEASMGELVGAARSEKGEMPAGAIIDTVVITATVEEINLEANTFKLKGPEGNVKEYTARDPENLKKAEVGDLVVITLTEAVALSVEKTTAE